MNNIENKLENSSTLLGDDDVVYLYRIENKNISRVSDGITSHDDLKGMWFTPNLETAINYLQKSQQTFGRDAKQIEGANLVIVAIPKSELSGLHVGLHPVAKSMDVENDNYIVPDVFNKTYISLDDVEKNVGDFRNFKLAREQIRAKVERLKTDERAISSLV
jgi:hypothetical protein